MGKEEIKRDKERMEKNKLLKCIMCNKGIIDEGILFCQECRKKDILKRVNALSKSKYHKNLLYKKEKVNEKIQKDEFGKNSTTKTSLQQEATAK